MKTLNSMLNTKALTYALFALLIAATAFFAVLPLMTDVNSAVEGPSLAALLASASVEPSCTITANPNPCTLGASGVCTSSISWSVTGMSDPRIYIQTGSGAGTVFGSGFSGTQDAPWITGSPITFIIHENWEFSPPAPIVCSLSVKGVPPPSYSCTGSIPGYAQMWDISETVGLSVNTPWVYADPDTVNKCEFHCNAGYDWNGSACVPPPPPPTPPTCTLDAVPASINQGQSSTLSWTTTNAHSISINQGVGDVAINGSRSVAPNTTTTYTLTATGYNGTVTCAKTVTVTPTPVAPVCSLTFNGLANATNVDPLLSRTWAWSSANGSTYRMSAVVTNCEDPAYNGTTDPWEPWTNDGTGTIAGGTNVGVPGAIRYGCKGTSTYVVTNAAGQSATCVAQVTFKKSPVTPAPTCTLTATPSTINQGQSSTLSWTTTNATSVSINQGIGSVVTDGSRSVTPSNTTLYTLTATGAGGTVTCAKTVTVVPPTPPTPTCTLTATPSTINQGQSATLSWTTTNATSVSIDQGIGAVATNGTRSVTPLNTTTYTLTATVGVDNLERTATCTKTIVVIPSTPTPTCTLTATPSTINQGQSSTLSWTTTNATSVSIDQGIGAVATNGTRSVTPLNTTTYTLTATVGVDNLEKTVTCTKTITVVPKPGTCALEITKTVQPTTAKVGDVLEYTLNFKNVGTADCTGGGVRVIDQLSSSLQYVSETHSSNVSAGYAEYPVYDALNHTMNWNAHVLTPGEAGFVTVKAKVKSRDNCGDFTIQNIGKITATELSNVWVSSNTVTTNITNACVTPTPTCTLDANPTTINQGQSSTLSWTTTNATSVSIDQGIGAVAQSGTKSVSPSNTTTYTLTATADPANGDGLSKTVICTKTVTVIPKPNAPTCTLTANPESINQGQSSTLGWTTTNATSVSIDQGIGAVATDGTRSVTPTNTTTYTLTATGQGGTVTCMKTVVVIPKIDPPTCTLTVTPSSITKGQSATLAWTTTNATLVSIDQGIGSVSATGTKSVSPTQNTTYTLTAKRGINDDSNAQTVTCVATLVVEDEPEPVTCDAFSASPSTLNAAGTTTLTWNTTNATNVTIDSGVGAVPVDGSKDVYVAANTTYTLTATDGGETVTCKTQVTINPVVVVPTCDAFTVSPTSVNRGETATLAWSTTNATSVSINNGVGTVSQDGNTNVVVNAETTYTLTATNGSASDTCQATVTIKSSGGGGGSSSPRCTLTASDKTITAGEKVTLSWKNLRTNDIIIKDNRGNVVIDSKKDSKVDEDEGSVVVKPTRSTSYTLTAIKGSKDRDCTVDINVSNVTVTSSRSQTPLVAGISLSSVPYTGFDAGPMLTMLFYTLLVLWGLGIAYVLVLKDGSVFGMSLTRAHKVASVDTAPIAPVAPRISPLYVAPTVTVAPQKLPTFATAAPVIGYEALYTPTAEVAEEIEVPETVTATEDALALLEARAHEAKVLISSDALRFIAGQSTLLEDQMQILDMVTNLAKATYPSENGWVVVNKEKIMSLLA